VLVLVFFVVYQQIENYLIGALIPIAAGIKFLLSKRLQARDATDVGAAALGDGGGD
jgi:hypothetical protein